MSDWCLPNYDSTGGHIATYVSSATSFLTQTGSLAFSKLRDGIKVDVLTQRGTWKPGTVRSVGRRPMSDLTFVASDGDSMVIQATAGSKWLLADDSISFVLGPGDFVKSLRLKVFTGDEVLFVLENEMWQLREVSEPRTRDAWTIELAEDFFFVATGNIVIGGSAR